jgi:SEC-C motif domain protein
MQPCPCGTGKNYAECCGIFIQAQQKPLTPEALMRSRYSAYTQANMDYIAQTMKSPAKDRFDAKSSGEWAKRVTWLRLEVKATSIQASKGFVEFIAYFKEQGKINTLHELSEFCLENGEWYYVDGKHLSSIASSTLSPVGRNDLCPCGSGKKYKKCCLLSK